MIVFYAALIGLVPALIGIAVGGYELARVNRIADAVAANVMQITLRDAPAGHASFGVDWLAAGQFANACAGGATFANIYASRSDDTPNANGYIHPLFTISFDMTCASYFGDVTIHRELTQRYENRAPWCALLPCS